MNLANGSPSREVVLVESHKVVPARQHLAIEPGHLLRALLWV